MIVERLRLKCNKEDNILMETITIIGDRSCKVTFVIKPQMTYDGVVYYNVEKRQ